MAGSLARSGPAGSGASRSAHPLSDPVFGGGDGNSYKGDQFLTRSNLQKAGEGFNF